MRLYGSLALTGAGHGTDRAMLLGLEGAEPETVDPDSIEPTVQRIRKTGRLNLLGEHDTAFDEPMQLLFMRAERLPRTRTACASARSARTRKMLREENYYSIGGGFIMREGETEATGAVACDCRRIRSTPATSCWRSVASTGWSCSSWCWRTSARGVRMRRFARACCASGA